MQTPIFIGFGVAGGQPRGYGVEFVLGLFDGGVRFQNGEDREIVIFAGGGLFWSGHEGSPQLGIGGEVELWLFGHDANDGLRFDRRGEWIFRLRRSCCRIVLARGAG